mgnify:CR=1 FL=1
MAEVDTVDLLDATGTTQTVATMSKALKTLGAPTDAKSTATDTTSATFMSVLKQISDGIQGLSALITSGALTTQLKDGTPGILDQVNSDQAANADAIMVRTPPQEVHLGEVGGKTSVFDVTLSLDTSAYASGDLLADTQACSALFRKDDGTGLLQSLMVIDQDDQKVAFDVYILSANVTMGTENSAPSITDANAVNILGIVSVATTDYKDLGGVSVANIKGLGIPIKAVSGTDDLYLAVVNGTGTPTFTASGVKLRLGVLLD